MHLFNDSGERLEDYKQGDQFSPLRTCVVSPAKCRKIGRVEGRKSCILLSEEDLDGRGRCSLSMDICLKSRGVDDISKGLICAGFSQNENQTSFSSFQAPMSLTSHNYIYINPQTADLQFHPFALLTCIRPTDFFSASCS